jgi:hypothetical protein
MDSTKTRTSGGKTLSSDRTAPLKPKPGLNGPPTWEEKLPDGYLIKALERIGKFADQQYQGGGLRVGFGSARFPFLESSFVDPQLAGEDGTRAAH